MVSWLGPWKGAFFVTLFFVVLASFLFWLDFFRAYETEVRILAAGRTPNSLHVPANLRELLGTLSFYDRVLSGSEDLEDSARGQSPLERRAEWQKRTKVKIEPESDVLVVSVRGNTLETSRLWATETTQTLLGAASFYYDIRSEVDLRIIDGPFTKRFVEAPVWYFFASLGSGALLSVLFFGLLRLVPNLYAVLQKGPGKQRAFPDLKIGEEPLAGYHVGESVPLIDPKKFLPSRPRTLRFEEQHEDRRASVSAASIRSPKASAPPNLPVATRAEPGEMAGSFPEEPTAPENLPFADSDFTFSEKNDDASEFSVPEPLAGPKVPETAEPTAEEYKARLNKLLKNGNE